MSKWAGFGLFLRGVLVQGFPFERMGRVFGRQGLEFLEVGVFEQKGFDLAGVKCDYNGGIFAYVSEVLDCSESEFFVKDNIAPTKFSIFNFRFYILNKPFVVLRDI